MDPQGLILACFRLYAVYILRSGLSNSVHFHAPAYRRIRSPLGGHRPLRCAAAQPGHRPRRRGNAAGGGEAAAAAAGPAGEHHGAGPRKAGDPYREGGRREVQLRNPARTREAGVEGGRRPLRPPERGEKLMKGVTFTGDLSVKEIRSRDLAVSDMRAKVTAGAGIYEIRPIAMKLFGGAGEGGIRIDLSGDRMAMSGGIAFSDLRLRKRDPALAP